MNRKTVLTMLALTLLSTNCFANVNNADNNVTKPQTTTIQNEQNDPIEIILKDHAKALQMMKDLEKSLDSDISQSRILFKDLKAFLIKHETMEQEAWYPELEKNAQIKDIIFHIKNEEENVSGELQNLEDITDDKQWKSKVKALIKAVKNHANEEQAKLFPLVKKKFDKTALDQIGQKLNDYRKQKGL